MTPRLPPALASVLAASAVAATTGLAACAGLKPPAGTTLAPVVVPDALAPPPDEIKVAAYAARGVQVYECRARPEGGEAVAWAFVAPEAELVDGAGQLVARHFGGPTWQGLDGSQVVGTVVKKVDAPGAGDIPWLLLATQPGAARGTFAKYTHVQRVATMGGVAPATGCRTSADLRRVERVPYQAQYWFFAKKW